MTKKLLPVLKAFCEDLIGPRPGKSIQTPAEEQNSIAFFEGYIGITKAFAELDVEGRIVLARLDYLRRGFPRRYGNRPTPPITEDFRDDCLTIVADMTRIRTRLPKIRDDLAAHWRAHAGTPAAAELLGEAVQLDNSICTMQIDVGNLEKQTIALLRRAGITPTDAATSTENDIRIMRPLKFQPRRAS